MSHQMDSGRRKDDQGQLIPAWYITSVVVKLNKEVVLEAMFGPSVSKNPYLRFELTSGEVGDLLEVSWQDNLGARRSDVATIS